ncbi:MAG: helix-turn-helix domain-containing protein [Pseudomonadota bacterium]
MKAVDNTPQFTPVPVRAMGDDRLTAAELRVLMAVGRHARFGGNGAGCYASNATVAAEASVHEKSVSRAYIRLEKLGYIRRAQSGNDGRRFQRFIVWDEEADEEGDEPVTDQPEVGNEPATQSAEVGNNCGYPKEIDLSSQNRFSEAKNRSRLSGAFPRTKPSGWLHGALKALSLSEEPVLPQGRSASSLFVEIERAWRTGKLCSDSAFDLVCFVWENLATDDDHGHFERFVGDIEEEAAA